MSDTEKIARNCVAELVCDLTGRQGIGDEWEAIDAATRRDILVTWRGIIEEAIERAVTKSQ